MPATGLKCRGWIAGNVTLWFAKIHRASRRLTRWVRCAARLRHAGDDLRATPRCRARLPWTTGCGIASGSGAAGRRGRSGPVRAARASMRPFPSRHTAQLLGCQHCLGVLRPNRSDPWTQRKHVSHVGHSSIPWRARIRCGVRRGARKIRHRNCETQYLVRSAGSDSIGPLLQSASSSK
jgi:hypothetical protein